MFNDKSAHYLWKLAIFYMLNLYFLFEYSNLIVALKVKTDFLLKISSSQNCSIRTYLKFRKWLFFKHNMHIYHVAYDVRFSSFIDSFQLPFSAKTDPSWSKMSSEEQISFGWKWFWGGNQVWPWEISFCWLSSRIWLVFKHNLHIYHVAYGARFHFFIVSFIPGKTYNSWLKMFSGEEISFDYNWFCGNNQVWPWEMSFCW